jgi:LacI family transcriptional regulator
MTTIKDVARACGVSTATVSYVLNGKRVLLPDTREKVLRAVREMNYHPNAVARGLSHKRMNTLGILFGTVNTGSVVSHGYGSSILQGMLTAASRAGYNVTFYTEAWKTADRSAGAYRDRRTDGIVVVAPAMDSDIVPGLARLEVPMVAISYPAEEYGVSTVDTDNRLGTRLVVEHLRALGHKRIAHLTGPPNMLSATVRRDAFRAVVAESGAIVPNEYIDGPDSFDTEEAYAQTRRLLALPEPPTAIFAANDSAALGAVAAARDLGIAVPIRLSIVGVDDTHEAASASPPLSSVRQPLTAIGDKAAQLLIERLAEPQTKAQTHLLAPELIERSSTAPPVT